VTTAAPKIGHSLHVPSPSTGLVITAYLLTLAVLIPLSGWLTARYGARPVFLSAIAIFTLSSIGCAASTRLGELVAMRVLQGVGGAMMVPVGRLTVIAGAAKSDLIRIISYVRGPARGPGDRAARRRADHDLRELALALSDQRAARGARVLHGVAADRVAR